jgi:hypothetical protein
MNNSIQPGGMKRGAELLPDIRNAKRICLKAEVDQKEGIFISLPDDMLIAIIQHSTLTLLHGLSGSCKRLHFLVFKHINFIMLNKEKEMHQLLPLLRKVANLSQVNLKIFVACPPPSPGIQAHNYLNAESLSLISRFPNLKILVLGKESAICIREGISHLTALQKLCHLELGNCELDASVFTPVLRSFTGLTHLRLTGMILSQNNALISFLTTTSLQRLELQGKGGKFLESDLVHLQKNSGLQELILATCRADIPDSFKYISHLTRLNHLSFFSDGISNQQLVRLKTLINLHSLHIAGCPEVNNDGISELAHLQNVQHLTIAGAPLITGECLKKINVLRLKSLSLFLCPLLQDQDLETLTSITTLKRLALQRSNELGNLALKNIAKHCSLQELILLGIPKIDNDGIRFLLNLHTLKDLFIKYCINVNQNGIDYLRQNHVNAWLNDLKIYFQPFLQLEANNIEI